MPYKRSLFRDDFDDRIEDLLKHARSAQRLKNVAPELRDMVFQCAVLHTSAAIETYVRLLIATWVQKLAAAHPASVMPADARSFIASQKLAALFQRYGVTNDEATLFRTLKQEVHLWPLMAGQDAIPPFVTGKALYDKATYPSEKNLNKLFARLGIVKIVSQISAALSRDAGVMIEAFQSVRTALAHAAPPPITLSDVTRLLLESKVLVGSIDRIFHSHVFRHGGASCW